MIKVQFKGPELLKQEAWQPNKLCCNLDSRPRNRPFGAHHWNSSKSAPIKHVKQEWCETSGKKATFNVILSAYMISILSSLNHAQHLIAYTVNN